MDDQDPTLMLQKHVAPLSEKVPDSQMQNLFAVAAGIFTTQPSSPSRNWEPPTVAVLQQALPQYEISALIARGGMGAVYKGLQRTLKRAVAVKVLPPDMEDGDLQFVERFKHEAQAMAQLSHPNIVAAFDAGETPDGLLYFVMEFVEGTDVAQLIASEKRLEPQLAMRITTAVCEALAFAHAEGIIHRDIKPSNIMIDKRGRVKVADFGLAKTVNVESTLMTRSNVTMGTPDFIAPEAMMPGVQMDGRADIYAVGVMLYQMLTGSIPRGRFELPSGVVPQVDRAFDAIVDKAMQTDREKRYSTATEMKTALERITPSSDGFQPSSLPIMPTAGTRRSLLKSRKPLLLGITAASVLGIAGWLLMHRPMDVDGPPSAASHRRGTLGPSAQPAALSPALEARAIKLWDSSAKLRKAPGIRWEDEAMRLDLAGPPTGPESRNAILRASIRAHPDAKGIVLALRRNDGPAVQARLEMKFAEGKAALSSAPSGGVRIGEWSLPRAYGADEWVRVELRAIGDEYTVLVDGQVIGTAYSEALIRPGEAMLYAGANGFFRDIVYIPLDDLSEANARQAAGVEDGVVSPKPPMGISTERWVNALADPEGNALVLAEITAQGLQINGRGQLKVKSLQGPKRDGAVRMKAFFDPAASGLHLRVRCIQPNDSGHYTLALTDAGLAELRRVDTVAKRGGTLAKYPLPNPLKLGQDYELELRVVGTKLTATFNGKALGETEDTTLTEGQFGIGNSEEAPVLVKSVEYLNLDGGVNSSSPSLPVSQSPPPTWRKAMTRFEDVPAAERAKGTLRWQDGWLEPTSASQSPPSIIVPGPKVRNGGIRVRGRMSPDIPFRTLGSVFLRRTTGADASNQVYRANAIGAQTSVVSLTLANEKTKVQEELARLPLPRPLVPGDEYELELIAIGDQIYVRLNDERLPVVTDIRLKEGSMGLHCIHPMRDVEVINLDDLSEAEARKAAGVEDEG